MRELSNKSTFCISCNGVFNNVLKYHSKNRCNPCYQRDYNLNKDMGGMTGGPIKLVEKNCKICKVQYGTINDKGRAVMKGSYGLCKSCYTKGRKVKKECTKCGNIMLVGSNSGLCALCKELEREEKGGIAWKRRVKPIPIVDNETYESIRKVLVKFKYSTNNLVDNFIVIDIYMSVNDDSILLDTLNEETQLVEMLKNLKKVFDFNKGKSKERLRVKSNKEIKIITDVPKKTYNTRDKIKKTADLKAYMREYHAKNKLLLKYRLLNKEN